MDAAAAYQATHRQHTERTPDMRKDIALLLLVAALLPAAWADDDAPALSRAAARGAVAELQQIIRQGADVNATDDDGETALMEAAARAARRR